jgi:large subunit ribosomal protein L35
MKRLKTESGTKKKIKITKTGKVLFVHQMGRHLRVNKSKSRIRRQKEPGRLKGTFAHKITKMLPYR